MTSSTTQPSPTKTTKKPTKAEQAEQKAKRTASAKAAWVTMREKYPERYKVKEPKPVLTAEEAKAKRSASAKKAAATAKATKAAKEKATK